MNYEIKFKNIPKAELTEEFYNLVSAVTSKIDETYLEKDFSEITGILSENMDRGYFSFEKDYNNSPLVFCMNEKEEVEILGNKFDLGYKEIQILSPIIEKGAEFNYKEGQQV